MKPIRIPRMKLSINYKRRGIPASVKRFRLLLFKDGNGYCSMKKKAGDVIPVLQNMLSGKPSSSMRSQYLSEDSDWKRVDEIHANAESHDWKLPNCTIKVHDLDREIWKDIPKSIQQHHLGSRSC